MTASFATSPTLHLLCGKIASGKSTLAAELAAAPGTVLISEDARLAPLYGEEMLSVADYVRCAATDAQFDLITRYFVAPREEEGFQTVVWRPTQAVTNRTAPPCG